ncbi:AbiV family abortive infection protein [Bradyrhizobium manausense]|uniref:AbiV family abortive infection protein n=1 Tax=Bradyrhizobium manausense TaxID=989370 RepID=UPI000A87F227|nr:AbiV family abortive infection protein [Bradyrhizobium manausense]
MADSKADENEASLDVLLQGAEKTFTNAEQLFFEAELLAKAGAVARALCLHQISLEECSKVNTLGVWAVSLILDLEVNQKKVLAAFARHSSKNKSNAYMLEPSEDELAARARGDWDAAREAFRKTQDDFHDGSNRNKNASFYVDWLDGEFVAPSERITKKMLEEITERNAEFLGYAHNSLKMLRTLTASPDVIRDLLSGFVAESERLRAEEPDNLEEAMETMLSAFLEAGKAKLGDRAKTTS